MKRTISTLLLVLALCAPAWACDDEACRDEVGQLARMSPAMLGAASGAAISCDSASEYLGQKGTDGTASAISPGTAICYKATASCSGPVNSGYIYHTSTGSATAIICLYHDDGDAAPDAADVKRSCTSQFTADGEQWCGASMGTQYNVTQGSSYWICVFCDNDGASLNAEKTSVTRTVYYVNTQDFCDNPPDEISGVTETTTGELRSIYISIGE